MPLIPVKTKKNIFAPDPVSHVLHTLPGERHPKRLRRKSPKRNVGGRSITGSITVPNDTPDCDLSPDRAATEKNQDRDVNHIKSASISTQPCGSCSSSLQYIQLQDEVLKLRKENEEMRENALRHIRKLVPRAQVLHRVTCDCNSQGSDQILAYSDTPFRSTKDWKWHLRGNEAVLNEKHYLAENSDVVLLVYKDYQCKHDADRFQWRLQNKPTTRMDQTAPIAKAESMIIVSS